MSDSKILEYIWLDGYQPEPSLRSKIKVTNDESPPNWSFDGSSTQQADGGSSDCLLLPVQTYKGPLFADSLVMCQVHSGEHEVHSSNTRAAANEVVTDEWWFGFEQEYFLTNPDGTILGWEDGTPSRPQGEYYCAVGAANVKGREISEAHLDACLDAGIELTGTNAEVALGQWEYQCLGKGIKAGDDLWVSRYLLHKVAEEFGVSVNIHPKPKTGDWNGSGMHANFSNEILRTCGSQETYEKICEAFRPVVKEHIEVYGAHNDQRLTGKHETQSIDEFSFGISDRGASIRIPILTVEKGWKGWLEDRRPASNGDPYKIASRIIKTVKSAKI